MTDIKIIHYSFSVPLNDIYSLLNVYKNTPRLLWKQNQNDLTFLGFSMVEELSSEGPDRFARTEEKVKQILEKFVDLTTDVPEYVRPRFFGGFSFQINEPKPNLWASFPEAKLILPKILFTNDGSRTWATISIKVDGNRSVGEIQILIEKEKIKILKVIQATKNNNLRKEITTISEELTQEKWRTMIDSALEQINKGELKKVVLARTCQITYSGTIDLPNMLEKLGKDYPNCYVFMFEFEAGKIFFGATPETLVSLNNSEFQTVALAGSIGRGTNVIADQALGLELLNSRKDLHEHELVVSSLEKKLLPFTENLTVSKKPGLRKLKNIQHLETRIFGKLKKNNSALSLLSSLHPTPALGGSPRLSALEFIRDAENTPRGWYAGPVGWLDADGDGLFAVAIRSGIMNKNSIRLFAGAGIVEGSDPDSEWEETKIKFQPLINVLSEVGIQNEI